VPAEDWIYPRRGNEPWAALGFSHDASSAFSGTPRLRDHRARREHREPHRLPRNNPDVLRRDRLRHRARVRLGPPARHPDARARHRVLPRGGRAQLCRRSTAPPRARDRRRCMGRAPDRLASLRDRHVVQALHGRGSRRDRVCAHGPRRGNRRQVHDHARRGHAAGPAGDRRPPRAVDGKPFHVRGRRHACRHDHHDRHDRPGLAGEAPPRSSNKPRSPARQLSSRSSTSSARSAARCKTAS